MTLHSVAQQALFLFGLGFLGANIKIGADLIRYQRKRADALLVWPRPKPPYYSFAMLLGIVQALLLAALVILRRPAPQIFGVSMMLIYFLAAVPLSGRIDRGFYRDGVWADRGFVPWGRISSVTWRENPVTLVLLSRVRSLAQHLEVPGGLYGEARKVLRERIREHDIQMGQSLGLGDSDSLDTV